MWVSFAKNLTTPGWNPESANPLGRGSGEAWKYVIKNFQSTGAALIPLGVVGAITNFLASLQGASNDELIHCEPEVSKRISKMLSMNTAERIRRGTLTSDTGVEFGFAVYIDGAGKQQITDIQTSGEHDNCCEIIKLYKCDSFI